MAYTTAPIKSPYIAHFHSVSKIKCDFHLLIQRMLNLYYLLLVGALVQRPVLESRGYNTQWLGVQSLSPGLELEVR